MKFVGRTLSDGWDSMRHHLSSRWVLGVFIGLTILGLLCAWNLSGRIVLVVAGVVAVALVYVIFSEPLIGLLAWTAAATGNATALYAQLPTLILLGTLGAVVVRKLYTGDLTWRITPFMVWSFLLFSWMCVTLMWSGSFGNALTAIPYRAVMVLLIAAETIRKPSDIRLVIIAGLIGLLASGIGSLYGTYHFFASGGAVRMGGSLKVIRGIKFSGYWPLPNALAYTVMSFLILGTALLRTRVSSALRIAVTGIVALGVATLFLTLCRGAILCTTVFFLAVFLASRRRWILIGALSIIMFFATLTLPVDVFGRVMSLTKGRHDASVGDRSQMASAGLRIAEDHLPFGSGVGTIGDLITDYLPSHLVGISSHDTYIDIVAETGVIGILLMMGMLSSVFIAAREKFRAAQEDNLNQSLRFCLTLGFLLILVAFFFEDMTGFPVYWLLFTIISLRPMVFDHETSYAKGALNIANVSA